MVPVTDDRILMALITTISMMHNGFVSLILTLDAAHYPFFSLSIVTSQLVWLICLKLDTHILQFRVCSFFSLSFIKLVTFVINAFWKTDIFVNDFLWV